jgi:hypothetical protein
MLLNFAAKNPGMTRVLIGDALVHENERLQKRINQLHDRIEAQLRQCLRFCGDKQSDSVHRWPICCNAWWWGAGTSSPRAGLPAPRRRHRPAAVTPARRSPSPDR